MTGGEDAPINMQSTTRIGFVFIAVILVNDER